MIAKIIWPLRVVLFYIFMIFITIFFASTGFLLFPLPQNIKYKYITTWSKIFIFLAKHICGLKYKVTGKNNIPKESAVVMSNHQSTWDAIAMQVILPQQCWVLKKELLYIPFFGWSLAMLSPIAIDRKKRNSIKQLIKQGKEKLKQNIFIVIFPEGTRVDASKTKSFSRSGAALAVAANKPILPIAHNAGKFWPRGIWIKKPGVIKIKIGEIVNTKVENTSKITTNIEKWINDNKS